MKDRRTILAGAIELFRGTLLGQKSSPGMATGPEPFGYKTGWIALKEARPDEVASFLKLINSRSASWGEGIKSAYDDTANVVFVTPPIKGWVLVVGQWAMGDGDRRSVDNVAKLLVRLSTTFGEAQGFATNRIIEYHHWILAAKGHLQRSFAYIGESGEVLANTGSLTASEAKLRFFKEPQERWNPNEEDVMTVAAGWSLDPTKLTNESGPKEFGVVGRVGLKIE